MARTARDDEVATRSIPAPAPPSAPRAAAPRSHHPRAVFVGALVGVCAVLAGAPASAAANDAGSDVVVHVETANELRAALTSATPGQTIELADGTYVGNFKVTGRAGTASAPVMLRGSAAAVLRTSSGGGNVLHLTDADHWTVLGVTLQHAQKGIMVDSSDHVTIDGVTVHDLDMEGIHFRSSSSYGVVRGSTIHDTGQNRRGMGEGVYVGSANDYSDRSDHVQILDNTIGPRVRGENVDVKEGTTGGRIAGNTFVGDGLTGANYDDSWVDVKGNDYVVEDNVGTATTKSGFQTHQQSPGWGCGTVFRGNHADLNGAAGSGRYAIEVTVHDPVTCPVTVTDDNTVVGGDGLVNPGVPVVPADGTPTPGPTEEPTPDPTDPAEPQPTDTPDPEPEHPEECDDPTLTAWSATTVYVGGDRVLHGGSLWQARWWTRGETPSYTEWGVWQHHALC
ncbi:right-handed parallel beta-helix repeat-containing protein [Cellulosimicrobium protaetiae]|uniref:Sheath polysaccharide-degrading enzyme n=1 Tax=Cellulosimicrobium protaetiae TaxID=2587808 RepID=A0A6M5UAG3_9MICO|nr:right-handed parallel beta-helix repeat-containing protein [Cellulosimicrobium protaetiae]QJW35517.1 sheath polysaccharide-degrading enzyme [Cellulosimicrobium protaetiae]